MEAKSCNGCSYAYLGNFQVIQRKMSHVHLGIKPLTGRSYTFFFLIFAQVAACVTAFFSFLRTIKNFLPL